MYVCVYTHTHTYARSRGCIWRCTLNPARFEAVTMEFVKFRVFGVVMPCQLVNSYRHFEGS